MTSVFIISAPSGSGKSTLVGRLLCSDPKLLFSVSYTTRNPRGAEVDGQSYHFISREDFETRIRRGEFLEHAEVFGNYYGTHRGILERAIAEHKDLVLDIDVQGFINSFYAELVDTYGARIAGIGFPAASTGADAIADPSVLTRFTGGPVFAGQQVQQTRAVANGNRAAHSKWRYRS